MGVNRSGMSYGVCVFYAGGQKVHIYVAIHPEKSDKGMTENSGCAGWVRERGSGTPPGQNRGYYPHAHTPYRVREGAWSGPPHVPCSGYGLKDILLFYTCIMALCVLYYV